MKFILDSSYDIIKISDIEDDDMILVSEKNNDVKIVNHCAGSILLELKTPQKVKDVVLKLRQIYDCNIEVLERDVFDCVEMFSTLGVLKKYEDKF